MHSRARLGLARALLSWRRDGDFAHDGFYNAARRARRGLRAVGTVLIQNVPGFTRCCENELQKEGS
ncbi:hypothetical protein BN2476_230352 [Paraburkholderia piptadeniae]|uniref:Uncharacterized protein n=1 Tax=Paraburkholderia piptadeniae TaxID=1701573 RepID=A0A1N7RY92_9BURK|nr:hypothetical protein BN2476_230352 [Paraburkholderia piptadeniae]